MPTLDNLIEHKDDPMRKQPAFILLSISPSLSKVLYITRSVFKRVFIVLSDRPRFFSSKDL